MHQHQKQQLHDDAEDDINTTKDLPPMHAESRRCRSPSSSLSPPSQRGLRRHPPSLAVSRNDNSQRSIFSVGGGSLSAKEHYTFSEWEKWIHFRRFPWKLLLHLLLILFMTMQMLVLNHQDAPYSRAMYRTFDNFFMPEGMSDGLGNKILFTNIELLASISQATSNYFQLNHMSTVSFYFKDPLSGAISLQPTAFTMRVGTASDYNNPNITPVYTIAGPQDLGPFTDGITPEVIDLLDAILSIHLDMLICNAPYGNNCYCWRIISNYDFSNGGNVRLSLAEHIECPCHEPSIWEYLQSDIHLLNLVILVLGLTYIILIIKSMIASVALYLRVRESFLHHSFLGTPHPLINSYTWEELPTGVKARFFSPWLALIFLGVASTLASVYINFLYNRNFAPSVKLHKIFAGLGCLLLWTTVLRYLEHHQTFYALVSTFNAAVPRLLPFLSGFIPIFIGYAVLGMSLFGRTDDIFSTVPKTFKSLWGMMNGDQLHNIVNSAESAQGMLIAHIYMFSYIALSIYVVINIIIATTEEAYFVSQNMQRLAHKYLERALVQLDDMDQHQQAATATEASSTSAAAAAAAAAEQADNNSSRQALHTKGHRDSSPSSSSSPYTAAMFSPSNVQAKEQEEEAEARTRTDSLSSFNRDIEGAETGVYEALLCLLIDKYKH